MLRASATQGSVIGGVFVRVDLYDGLPGIGNLLANGQSILIDPIDYSNPLPEWLDIPFPDSVSVTPGSTYYLDLKATSANQLSEFYLMGKSGNVYSDGNAYLWPGYTENPNVDFSFRTYSVSTVLAVDIDIRPYSSNNQIRLDSWRLLPVAIFSTESFDATTVDPSTVQLAGAETAYFGLCRNHLSRQRDINGDGILDLLVKFEIQDLDPAIEDDGYAVLTGTTFEGQDIIGSDFITIITCP